MKAARLLDLTRSMRRSGQVPTGIDRVERAYLSHFAADDVAFFGLVRTAFGYLLLDRRAARTFLERLVGTRDWPKADALSRLPRRHPIVAAAETSLRQDAVARTVPMGLQRMVRQHLPSEFIYFNVGHSNLTDRVLSAASKAGGKNHVLVHDVIPLALPEFQRPGTVAPFEAKMRQVRAQADLVIYPSDDSQQRAESQMNVWGPVPPAIVAHLGTIVPTPDSAELPEGWLPDRPYFVTVGTIEPRKNHAFLLDLWEQLGPDAPPLLICGQRGWRNEAVFERLDHLPPDGPVREVSGLSDAALAAVVKDSAGTLFPSLAEGFGLPPVEALSLGARVLCNDLPIFREILGNVPEFVPVSDPNSWLTLIRNWDQTPPTAGERQRFQAPIWADHFNTVLRLN